MSPVFPGFNTVDLHFADAELLGQYFNTGFAVGFV